MENMKENKRSLTIDIKNLIVRWKDSDMTVHKLGERKYLVLKVETFFMSSVRSAWRISQPLSTHTGTCSERTTPKMCG